MNVTDTHQTVKLTLAVAEHEYKGEKDSCQFRNGNGHQIWKKEQWCQQYTGNFLQDCLHNYGTYTWRNIDSLYQHTYEGKYFTSNLEGYGILSYPDGKTYEGLFKANRRYGPGVLTHPDGSQDVGLWEGNNLVRLNQNLPNKPVPVLAQSVQGKAYLLNYKELVSIQKKDKPVACYTSPLGAAETILKENDILYSKFVKNSNSVFFNQNLYYDNYFDNESDWTINVVYDNDGDPINIQIRVSYLLAWNNENLAISIMKHAFMHRNYETILTYNVSDISTGNRTIFKDPGSQETYCLELFESCCQDDETVIAKLICQYDLYPDVSDFQGNNGVIYAATYDQESIIKVLTNFGANVDHMNDECLTALSMNILKYTAYKYDVKTWEFAFLPPPGGKAQVPGIIQQWRTKDIIIESSIEENEIYLFDLSCVHPVLKKGKGKKGKDTKPKDDKKKKKRAKVNEPTEPEIVVDPKAEYLGKVLGTIVCLLQCGAKPNYGECPFPPLILSVFARSVDIVDQLIIFGANTNIETSFRFGSLTPLLVLASLPPCIELISMAYILLCNGANPNKRANPTHWENEFKVILAGTEADDYYNGKTPLHLLCMRYDFINDTNDYLGELGTLFINLGADPNMVYLSHIPLTLAMIRGNIKMMQRILDSGLVDPNQGLGNNMGVPLTVLILKRYENILPLDVCEKIYKCLLHYYANPFNVVPGFEGNSIEFTLKENIVTKDVKTPKSGMSGKSEKSGTSNKSKGGKHKGNQQVIQLLYDAAEIILVKRIQRKVVQMLYQYKIECSFDDPIFEQIVKYIDVDTTIHYLQILLDYDKIVPCKTFCYFLLDFVNSKIKKKPDKHKKDKKIGSLPKTIEDMAEELDYSQTTIRAEQFSFNLLMPEMDLDESKFKVCFECLRKNNQILVLCPKCQLVYFCSQECNTKNMKKKNTKHPCNFLFYNSELNLMTKQMETGLPLYKSNIFDRFNTLRQQRIDRSPNYLEKIKIYDKIITDKRIVAKKERERDAKEKAIRGKKGKGKSKETSKSGSKENNSRGRSGSPDDEGDDKMEKRKSRKPKGGQGRRSLASNDDGVSKRKKERDKSTTKKGTKGGKGRRSLASSDDGVSKRKKERDKSTTKKGTKGGKGRRSLASSDDEVSKRKKERDKSTTKKGTKGGKGRRSLASSDDGVSKRKKERDKSTTKKGTKEKSLTRKSMNDNYSRRTATKDKTTDSPYGHPKQYDISAEKSLDKSYDKDTKDMADKTAEGQQTNVSPDGHPRQLNGDLSLDIYGGVEGQGDVQDRNKFTTDEFRETISNICDKFDYKFFQMFMPYCAFVNGQLYYKFDNVNKFYKLTYSTV